MKISKFFLKAIFLTAVLLFAAPVTYADGPKASNGSITGPTVGPLPTIVEFPDVTCRVGHHSIQIIWIPINGFLVPLPQIVDPVIYPEKDWYCDL